MMKRMGNLKWVAGVAAVMVLLLSVPTTTEAHGRRYSGMDPIVMVDDYKMNIRVEWPSDFDCSLTGPVHVNVRVPLGMTPEVIEESIAGHGGCTQETFTTVEESAEVGSYIAVQAMVPSDRKFAVKVKVDINGYMFREYSGSSNKYVEGSWISMYEINNALSSTDSTESAASDDELTYTYETNKKTDKFYWQNGKK